MNTQLLIKYATRSRPERMFAVIDSVFKNADHPDKLCLLLSLDNDDKSVYNKEVLSRLEPYLKSYNIKAFFGRRQTKIEAFNRDINKIKDWEYLIHLTDFTEISVKGFDTSIFDLTNSLYADFLFAMKSLNSDGRSFNNIHVISKNLYDKQRYLYHPEIKSNFEEEELESRLKDYIHEMIDVRVHRYVHPKWLYFSPDSLLVENIKNWKEDLETLERLTNEA